MNAPVPIRPARATAINGDTFRAWLGNGTAIDASAATTLDEARDLAAPECQHKGTFWIEQTRADGRRFIHTYGVTKSTKKGYFRDSYDGGPRVFVGFCEAKLLASLQVYTPLEPVAPWQWSSQDQTGARHGLCPDLVGTERGVVNA
jgi:hypothetical protein